MKKLLVILAICALLILASCVPASKISDIKNNPDKFLGEKITLEGAVKNPIKLGQLSGFTIVDETGEMPVASDTIPAEGSKVIIEGTLMKEMVIGYYIQVKTLKTL